MIKRCELCNKEFDSKTNRFCSVSCRQTYIANLPQTKKVARNNIIKLNKSDKQRRKVVKRMKGNKITLGKKFTDKQKENVSVAITKSWEGDVERKLKFARLSINSKRYKSGRIKTRFGELHYRSSYEKKFIELVQEYPEWVIKTLECEPFAIEYEMEGRKHHYIPDFLINNKLVVEVKPYNQLLEYKNMEKWAALRDYCEKNNLKYQVVDERFIFDSDLSIPGMY